MKRFLFTLWFVLISFGLFVKPALAASERTMEAKAVWMIEERPIEFEGKQQYYQKIRFLVTTGPDKGKEIIYENGNLPAVQTYRYKIGDHVIMGESVSDTGETAYYIIDQVRRSSLYVLSSLFVVLVLMISRTAALRSLMALGLSFAIIFMVVLPQILQGKDPVLVALITAILIIPLTFYLSHGFNRKTHIAALGTLIALGFTSLLAKVSVQASQLTGYASEEAVFVQSIKNNQMNIQGLLLAGIIIGLLGMLDDVTISQAAVVEEIHDADPKLSKWKLFRKSMKVGTDHISSMINTLILVYAGASMPLLLLFVNTPKPVSEMINYEMIAEEIVRTMVGSIGIVIAVPLTTGLAVWWLKRSTR